MSSADTERIDLFEEDHDPTLTALVEIIRDEIEALAEILPDALVRQWETSPVPKPRDDTTERASGDRSDPTGATALDDRRLRVRDGVRRSRRLLLETATRTRGTRLYLERVVAEWDGEQQG